MHIDWFVLAAQIFNFLVLVFALKYLLYDKILGAIDAREAKIALRFDEAERLKIETQQSAQAYNEKNRELQDKADELMNQAQKASLKPQSLLYLIIYPHLYISLYCLKYYHVIIAYTYLKKIKKQSLSHFLFANEYLLK